MKLSVRINRSISIENVDENEENIKASLDDKKISMRDYLSQKYGQSSANSNSNCSIQTQIRKVQYQPQHDPDDEAFDIRQYWLKAKYEDRMLWKLADTVLAIPATQCSVERDFSFFNLILTKQRTQLSSKHLESIMHVRTNAELINSALTLAFKDL